MKKTTFKIILMLFVASNLISQTATSVTNFGHNAEGDPGLISPVNPWFGAQIGYMYGGSDNFLDDFLASATVHKVLLRNDDKTFGLPIVGNLSSLETALSKDSIQTFDKKFQSLISSDKGAHVGLYPYKYLSKDNHSVLYGIFSLKLNKFEMEEEDSESLLQGRIGVGYEHGFGQLGDTNKKRWIFSISPFISLFSSEKYNNVFGEEKSNLFSIESSLIYALTDGIGVMVEANYTNGELNPLKVGLIYAFEKVNKSDDDDN